MTRIQKFKQELMSTTKKIDRIHHNLEEKLIKIKKDLNVHSIIKMLKSKINVEDAKVQFENIEVTMVGLSQIIDNFKNEFDSHK